MFEGLGTREGVSQVTGGGVGTQAGVERVLLKRTVWVQSGCQLGGGGPNNLLTAGQYLSVIYIRWSVPMYGLVQLKLLG